MIPEQPERARSGPILATQLVFGLGIVALGVLFTLDNLDILNARDYLPFWPIVLLAAGLANLSSARDGGSRTVGGLLTFIGAWLLLSHFGWWHLRFRDLWPLILVLWGALIVWRGWHGVTPHLPRRIGDSNQAVSVFALMSGFDRMVMADPFRGGDVSMFMGGGKLDLTRALMGEGETATINVFALMGGMELRIPETWSLDNRAVYFMGGSDDRTRTPANPAAPRLILRGFVMMGGIEIKN
jgi:predicted membrane protein